MPALGFDLTLTCLCAPAKSKTRSCQSRGFCKWVQSQIVSRGHEGPALHQTPTAIPPTSESPETWPHNMRSVIESLSDLGQVPTVGAGIHFQVIILSQTNRDTLGPVKLTRSTMIRKTRVKDAIIGVLILYSAGILS